MKTGAGKGVPGALMLVRAGVLVCFVAAFLGLPIKDSNAFLLEMVMAQFSIYNILFCISKDARKNPLYK